MTPDVGNHDAQIAAALARIEMGLEQLQTKVDKLEGTVRGNGQVGLVTRVAQLEHMCQVLQGQQTLVIAKLDEQGTRHWSYAGAIVTALITTGGLVTVAIVTAVIGPMLLRGYMHIVP